MNANKILALICIFALQGCSDIIEDNIENIKPILISPSNGSVNSFKTRTFSWQEVEHADAYHLQVAEPSFEFAQRVLIDSVLNDLHFDYDLLPGTYQWRLRAENKGYKTTYTTNSFTVDSTYNLSDIEITLLNPLQSDTITDVTSVEFTWERVPQATYYTIFIQAQNDDLSPTITMEKIASPSFTTTKIIKQNIDYKWKVKAIYDNGKGTISESPFSIMAKFSVRIPKVID